MGRWGKFCLGFMALLLIFYIGKGVTLSQVAMTLVFPNLTAYAGSFRTRLADHVRDGTDDY